MNNRPVALSFLAAVTAAASLVPSPATATSEHMAGHARTCSVRLVTTKAINLQHDNTGTDQIKARLGNTLTRERSYTLGQRRNTLSDGTETFSDAALVTLQVEVLGGAWLTIDSHVIQCENTTRDLVFTNSDARYKARADIDILP